MARLVMLKVSLPIDYSIRKQYSRKHDFLPCPCQQRDIQASCIHARRLVAYEGFSYSFHTAKLSTEIAMPIAVSDMNRRSMLHAMIKQGIWYW